MGVLAFLVLPVGGVRTGIALISAALIVTLDCKNDSFLLGVLMALNCFLSKYFAFFDCLGFVGVLTFSGGLAKKRREKKSV